MRLYVIAAIALTAFCAAGQESPDSSLVVLRTMARSPDAQERLRALEGLTVLGGAEDVPILLRALQDTDDRVRALAVRTLQTWPPDEVYRSIVKLLQTGAPGSFEAAGQVLPRLKADLEEPFLELLVAPESDVAQQMLAAYALGRMRSEAAVPEIGHKAWVKDRSLALVCVRALTAIGTESALLALEELYTHPEQDVRNETVESIFHMDHPGTLHSLGALAAGRFNAPANLERRAALLLGAWPPGDAIPLLIDAMAANRRVRASAQQVLVKWAGRDLGRDAAAWRQWYDHYQGEQDRRASDGVEPGQVTIGGVPGEYEVVDDW